MISWINKLLGKKGKPYRPGEWKTDSSLFSFIKDNIDEQGKLKESARDLPDEKTVEDGNIRYSIGPGVLDSIFGANDSERSRSDVKELTKLLKRIAISGDELIKIEFYQRALSLDSVIGIIDDLLDSVTVDRIQVKPYLFDFSKDLAFKTGQRNTVKLGLALLGICQQKDVLDDIKLFGLHDEFTIFSVVAISNISDDAVTDLWDLAKKVDGWGKIRTVEHLAKMELTSPIKDWLLTDGYKNYVMYEYLAYTCAVAGELHYELEKETISEQLFISAAEIIDALLSEGPAEDISVYDHASIAIVNFVRHAENHSNMVLTFIVLNHIKEYLAELGGSDAKITENGWSEDVVSNCLIDIAAIINNKDWQQVILSALQSDDDVTYWKGKQAAKIIGLDIWEIVWEKLKQNPSKYSLWRDIVMETKADYVDEIVNMMIETFPLKEISTGPKDSFGFGADYEKHAALESMITFLGGYPGKGVAIILAGLNSPVTRNRNITLKTLYKWGENNWPDEVRLVLLELKKIEPDKDTKVHVALLLAGKKPELL